LCNQYDPPNSNQQHIGYRISHEPSHDHSSELRTFSRAMCLTNLTLTALAAGVSLRLPSVFHFPSVAFPRLLSRDRQSTSSFLVGRTFCFTRQDFRVRRESFGDWISVISNLTIWHCTFRDFAVEGKGGAFVTNLPLNCYNVFFVNSTAVYGGAFFAEDSVDCKYVSFTRSSTKSGAGCEISGGREVFLDCCLFSIVSAEKGGAIATGNVSLICIKQSNYTFFLASRNGAGIVSNADKLIVRHTLFVRGVSGETDGGIAHQHGSVAIEGVVFARCVQRRSEGSAALRVNRLMSKSEMRGCTFTNCSRSGGFVIRIEGEEGFALLDCRFDEERQAAVGGSAIVSESGCTFGTVCVITIRFVDIGWRQSRTPTYQPIGDESEVDDSEEEGESELPIAFRVLLVLAGIMITVAAELTIGITVRWWKRSRRAFM
jgi:hypothetical protein